MFFRLLLYVLIAYFVISFFRKLFSALSSQPSKKSGKSNTGKEGEITVEDPANIRKGSINKDEGDYIDYEELD